MEKNRKLLKIINVLDDVLTITIFLSFVLRINIYFFLGFPLSAIAKVLSLFVFLLVLARFFINKEKITKLDVLLLLFFLMNCISTLLNRNTFSSESISMLSEMFLCFYVFYYSASKYPSKLKRKIIPLVYLITVSIMAIIALFIFFTRIKFTLPNGYILEQTESRISNIFVNPNQAAIHSLLCIPFLCRYIYLYRANKTKIIGFLFLFLVHVLVIILSDSRTGYFILLLGTIYGINLYIKRLPKGKKRLPILFGSSVVLIGITSLIKYMNSVSHKFKIGALIESDKGLFYILNNLSSNRLVIWSFFLKSISGIRFLYGHGICCFLTLWNSQNTRQLWYENLHNLFIDICMRTGIIGLSLFLAFTILIIKLVKNNFAKMKGVDEFYTFLFFVVILFLFSQNDCAILYVTKSYNNLFWLLLGCVVYDCSNGGRENNE